MAGILIVSSAASAAGLDTYPGDPTEAEASIFDLSLNGSDLIGLASSHAGSVADPGPNREAFAGSIVGGEVIDFGAGYTIPLDQFIDFGQAGVLLSESTATDGRNGEAISGIAGADGGLTLDGADGEFGTATVDLLSLFKASGVGGVTDIAIDQADFSFGLGGAWVEAIDGAFQDPDAIGGMGQYRVGDAKIVMHSPVIEQAAAGISTAAGQMEQAILDAVNPVLNLGTLIPGATIDTTITSTLQQDMLDAVLLAPITTDDGLASIDIGAGTVTFDIGRFGGNDDGIRDPSLPTGINNQNPNTELIDSDTYPFIASSIHDVIEKVIDVAVGAAIASLQSVNINVAVSSLGMTAGWDMTLAGVVSNQFCNPGGLPGIALCATINTFLATVPGLMAPVLAGFTTPGSPLYLYDIFTLIKTDLITVPIRAVVDPFLEIAAQVAFSVQLNHQEVQSCTPPGGTDTLSGLEISALSIGVGGGLGRLGIGNAGLRVDACNLAGPSLSVSSPAPAGGSTDVTSGGWAPNAQVSLQLTSPEGTAVGDPVVVTTDGTGTVPAGTVVPVPGNAPAGEYTVVGSATGEDPVTANLTVYAPTLDAQSPVAPEDCSAITSAGWLPNAPLTLQLENATGDPVGAAVPVTTDANGTVPPGTCVPIPAGTPEGDYTVVGTDGEGTERTAPLTVEIGAITPTLSVTSPAPAGGETTVTSDDWNPNSPVSFQLTAPNGDPVGDPVDVTTDGTGTVPSGTTVPIPANALAGDYTVVGTDADDNTISAPLVVYAPTLDAQSPVAPGVCSAITSGGWLPNSAVTFQLSNAAGNPVGAAVPVTTDANGTVPAGTCVQVPADAPEGDYEVEGTDGTAVVTDPLVVDAGALAPTLAATSPVPAGGETTVTSTGWNPDSEVSLQLTAPNGDAVGEPVVVTTTGDGSIPDATTVPVPADAPAGGYTVVGTDPDGNNATAPLEVYAPTLDASSPVPAGGSTTVTSAGWLPNTPVTLQLTDPDGNPLGAPVPVTTTADGAVPDGTTVPVPLTADPGTGYSVVGTDAGGAEATDAIEVTAAVITPALDASSPVPAGGETTVTSGGWIPGSQVSLQLENGAGDPVGAPVLVMTDGDGDVPTGTTVPVPAGTTPGDDYSVVGTDLQGNEASDVLAVYFPTIDAASPVPAGGTSAVTSTGWAPDSAVTLQLTDGAGTPVGDPVPVTADGAGALPPGTSVPVPAGTTPGTDYEVVGTDANGVEVSDVIEVTAAGINPMIDATSPVPVGGETTVISWGWNPASEVSLQLIAPNGDAIGDPVVVTTTGDGSVPGGTTVHIPGIPAGDYRVVATDPDDVQVSDMIRVYAPVIDASSPVPAGGTTTVTSSGWLPDSPVEFQLRNGAGDPVGDPVSVTTGADGVVPDGTTITVPVSAPPGVDYEVVGTDLNGAFVADTIEVTAAEITPTLDASSPVPAGGETTVTSGGWVPGSQVSLQLTDPDGDAVGSPVQVMADGDGDVPTDTTVPVPAAAPAGDYTVVGTDADENTASDTLAVYAPTLEVQTPVPPGTCALVESGGWLPNTPVTLQLTDADGNPVGTPVTVTADANGDLPPGTCVTIPEGTPAGDYEVVGTDDNGAEITAPVVVDPDAIAPSIAVTSPVPAGGETTVDSDGWNPGTQVSLQLVDPADSPVGEPIVVTTTGDGSVPDGTSVPVPLTAAPGAGYSVVATDEDDVEVSAPLEVTAAVLAPTLSASSPAPAGGVTTVQSTGWVPGSGITLQLTDGAGAPVGDPVDVTADSTGAVPAGTSVPIPLGTDAGDYTVDAVDDFGNEASGALDVYAPSISASSPVVAGDATEVTSTGWLPNTAVELQLEDVGGNPIGDAVTVMSDGEGTIPDATTVPVPESTPAGTEYYVVGTDENDAAIADQIEVLAAGSAPTLQASSPVPAGGESTVTSGGWEPETEVTLQLTDAEGAPVGDPVVVTTNGDGDVPDGTTVPVPADADAGTYAIEGSDDQGNEASAPLSIYAPQIVATSPVPAGGSTTVTSTGWMPNSEVTLQLTDVEGDLVGDALPVTTNGDGEVPAGTTLPVPADAEPGTFAVVGTDANGAEVSAAVEVTAAGTGPTLSATSPVPAGGETTVTSTGWEPAADVSLQLTNPAGDPVGEPVVVAANGDGDIPDDTTVPVPADATAGTYKVVGTDEDEGEASATLAVYAPRLLAASPVPAGGSSQITSDGWVPNSEVTLQLVDGDGEPVGEPVEVAAGSGGALPAGTTVRVPGSAAPGDYAITAVDETGASLEAALAVTAAAAGCGTPTIAVSPTAVAPGSTVTVTGTGFAAGSTATVQLYDAGGKALLTPALTLPVGESCGFTITVKVPAGAAAGTYKIVGTDDVGNAASANLTITGGAGGAGGGSGGLAATGGESGVFLPLALVLIALGTAVLIIRRPGVVADKQ